MGVVRVVTLAAMAVLGVVGQVSAFPYVGYDGVSPNLVLLLVVAVALTRGPEAAMTLGFLGGLAVDVAPPADHLAGRWALALVVVGYLAGRVRQDAASSPLAALAVVAASSFVGTSLYLLSGMLLRDPAVPAADAIGVLPLAVGFDVLLAPFVLPLAMRVLRGRNAARPVPA